MLAFFPVITFIYFFTSFRDMVLLCFLYCAISVSALTDMLIWPDGFLLLLLIIFPVMIFCGLWLNDQINGLLKY